MQTVLITGANGFVGSYVAQYLIESDLTIVATGLGPNRLPFFSEKFIYETLDFTNEEAVENLFEKYQPDFVVHSGAMSKPDDCEHQQALAYKVNVSSTIYLLKAAAKYQSFFLFLSTDFIFKGDKGFYAEEDEAGPVNYYGKTKWLAENEVKKYPFDWSIVRTVLVYGPPRGGRNNLLTMVANELEKGKTLKIFNDQVRTPTYVEDLALAIVHIIQKKAKGIYHISGEDVLTPYKMAMKVAAHLGFHEKQIIEVTEASFPQDVKRPLITGFDLSKALKNLNYKPTSFEAGLQKTFEGWSSAI